MDATFPNTLPTTIAPGTTRRWVGRIVTGIPVLFLIFDVAIKLSRHPAVEAASAKLGLPPGIGFGLGVLLGCCLVTYLVPRLAPLGAVLLTGYLGGAVFVHVRVGDPLFSHVLFPIYVGVLLWLGLFLRDPRVRGLLAATPR
jgi:hypothetical protein